MITIGNYTYIPSNQIGKGSFSNVFKGKNINNNDIVAIKHIQCNNNIKYVLNEINILKELQNTPFIINLIDDYIISNDIYLIMNFYTCDLSKYIKQHIFLEESLSKKLFSQLIFALKELYNKNIFHRDLKPSNILIDNDNILLTDFGFAKYIDYNDFDTHKIKHSIVGSPLFMSPELYKSNFNIKSDIWSVGMILFEMSAGYNFLHCTNIKELSYKIQNSNIPLINNISPECNNLILQLLDKNIDKRISWDELFNNKWLLSDSVILNTYNSDRNNINENINENITPNNISSNSSDISSDEYLILSTENIDNVKILEDSYSWSTMFEQSIETLKHIFI